MIYKNDCKKKKNRQSEQKIKQMLEKELDKNTYELTERLSLRAEGEGGRTQLDLAVINKKTEKLTVIEAKSSKTAPPQDSKPRSRDCRGKRQENGLKLRRFSA